MVSYLTHWLEVVDTHVHTQNCISMWTKQDDGGSGTSHHDDNGVLDCKAEIRYLSSSYISDLLSPQLVEAN